VLRPAAMIPRTHVGSADVPGGGTLRLMQRGADFSIMLDGVELMNSRMSGSEEALATLSCTAIAGRPRVRMLVGGLGMGFTLRAALANLPRDAEVVVAELVPEVVAWARGPMAAMHGDSLDDRRVRIVEADVGALIGQEPGSYDAILLDVDNGPDGLTRKGNDRLYTRQGLAAAKTALRPGGVLAVWSSGPDADFTKRLTEAGFAVNVVKVRARQSGKGGHHVIWMATRGR
jgi:spermidine synthase